VSEQRAAAILQEKPTKVHTDAYRAGREVAPDFPARLTRMVEAQIHQRPVIVSLPPVSEKQPSK